MHTETKTGADTEEKTIQGLPHLVILPIYSYKTQTLLSMPASTCWLEPDIAVWEALLGHEKYRRRQVVVEHAFNPRTWEAEAGKFLSSRPTWSTEWVPGQQGYKEKPCLEKKERERERKLQRRTLSTSHWTDHRVPNGGARERTQEDEGVCSTIGGTTIWATQYFQRPGTKTSTREFTWSYPWLQTHRQQRMALLDIKERRGPWSWKGSIQ